MNVRVGLENVVDVEVAYSDVARTFYQIYYHVEYLTDQIVCSVWSQ